MNIGEKIVDGTCAWVLRHKGEMHNIGDIWMTKASFNADGFMIHAITGLAMLDVHICDGTNGTINMVDRFPTGSSSEKIGTTGGENEKTLTTAQMPSHTHTGITDAQGNHEHGASAWTDTQGAHQHSYVKGVSDSAPRSSSVNVWSGTTAANTSTAGAHGHNVGVSVAAAGEHQHNISTHVTGDGQAFDNRPAYVAVAFVQKIY